MSRFLLHLNFFFLDKVETFQIKEMGRKYLRVLGERAHDMHPATLVIQNPWTTHPWYPFLLQPALPSHLCSYINQVENQEVSASVPYSFSSPISDRGTWNSPGPICLWWASFVPPFSPFFPYLSLPSNSPFVEILLHCQPCTAYLMMALEVLSSFSISFYNSFLSIEF